MHTIPDGFQHNLKNTVPTKVSRKRKTAAVYIAGTVFTVLHLPIVMQYCHLLDFRETVNWLVHFPGPYLVNTVIIALLFLLFYSICNSLPYGFAALVVFCSIFSIADMQKMRILHQPLLPGDLIFFRQALLVTRMYTGGIIIGLITLCAIVVLMILLRGKLLHCRLHWRARVVSLMLITGSLLCIAANLHPLIKRVNKRYGIVDEFWSQISNYRKNGVLFSFLMNTETLRVNKPEQYTRQSVDALLARCSTPPAAKIPEHRDLPNVIIYMNESFWDLTRISQVTPPCDPIPFFRSLVRKRQSLALCSPVFGGNTCDAEFEVLTGMSCSFFPAGVRAYNQFIQRPIPSLVRLFREHGYRTTALHTFKRWFWNRGNVYRHIGFDRFISIEDMDDPPLRGKYVGDDELVRRITHELDSAEEPQFIFALSMQNHGPYDEHRYDTLDCPVATGLSSAADREYNTYMQGLIDADRSLRELSRYIRKSPRRTVVFFFGDHLPGFTHVYRETGNRKRVKECYPWAFSTRGVWYANYPIVPQPDTAISMRFLPLAITRQAGLQLPPWYRFLDRIRSENPTYTGRHLRSSRGDTLIASSPEWLLIYDALFGKGYADPYCHAPDYLAGPPEKAFASARTDSTMESTGDGIPH